MTSKIERQKTSSIPSFSESSSSSTGVQTASKPSISCFKTGSEKFQSKSSRDKILCIGATEISTCKRSLKLRLLSSSLDACRGQSESVKIFSKSSPGVRLASRKIYFSPTISSISALFREGFVLLCFLSVVSYCAASEFPERECCDPIYPVATATPAPPPSAVTLPAGKNGLNVRTSIAILNCLLARQLCFEDASCSAILEIIPRVCGSELVACSTVTVTKCQAALRTLQAFPFFKPTCLCREPAVDPECNSFRDFLFDHPCVFVLKKEKDPYPVEALPTCNYALNVCHGEKSCAALFDTFKAACRARDGDCKMDDRDQCREAWTGLRMSPLFGCICPNNHMKKRCDRIFALVNHNPCVEGKPVRGEPDLFMTRLLRLRHVPRRPTLQPPSDRHPDRFNLHPSRLPESSKPPVHHKHHHKSLSLEYKSNVTRYVAPDGTILLVTDNGTQVITDTGGGDLIRAIIKAMGHRSRSSSASASRRHPNVSRARAHSATTTPDGKKVVANKTSSTADDWIAGSDLEDAFEPDEHHVSPHVMQEGHRRLYGKPGRRKGGGRNHQPDGAKKIGEGGVDVSDGGPVMKISLHSTCHLALDRCIRDGSCTTALTPVLQTCDASRCERENCMESLRNFYTTPSVSWNVEIAFCLCKKTDNKEDPCMNAQEKLHPVCAQREPGASLPACHVLAQTCREQPDCRSKLELYEQSCAVDSVTKRCAGAPEYCRSAVLAMLGTELRTACACKGTDFAQLYDCLGWQRLLWLNPCVVEAQSDFHVKTYGAGSTPPMTEIAPRPASPRSTAPPTTTTTVSTTALIVRTRPTQSHQSISAKNGRNIEVEIQGSIVSVGRPTQEPTTPEPTTTTTTEMSTTTTTMTTTTTTEKQTPPPTTTVTTTTEMIEFCIVQRPELDDQRVQKGHTIRLYRDAELDCSELCHCNVQLTVTCHAVCVRHAPCRTALAFYSHAAPAYQAYRGRCYCYSGSFICMRPNPGEYSLPPGVYLLLGFSSQDEALLRPHTRLGLEDAVRILQDYMMSLSSEATNCTLTLFNVTNENMIIAAGVTVSQKEKAANPLGILDTDKIECIGLLDAIKIKINTQDYDIASHLLLSIFKIAEVDVVYPPPSSALSPRAPASMVVVLAALLLSRSLLQDLRSSALLVLVATLTKLAQSSRDTLAGTRILLLETVAHIFYSVKNVKSIMYNVFTTFPSRAIPRSWDSTIGTQFPRTLALRVNKMHINLAVRDVLLSVICNFRSLAVAEDASTLGPESLVNSAILACITSARSKTDVFLLFFIDEMKECTRSPIFLTCIIVLVILPVSLALTPPQKTAGALSRGTFVR